MQNVVLDTFPRTCHEPIETHHIQGSGFPQLIRASMGVNADREKAPTYLNRVPFGNSRSDCPKQLLFSLNRQIKRVRDPKFLTIR
jgi:hypothetical protein